MIDYFFSKLGITPSLIAGIGLWALALYVVFWKWSDRLVDRLNAWLIGVDRSIYSAETLNRRPPGWEERSQLFASVLSVLPALAVALVVYLGLCATLGGSWALALGLMISIGAGVYQLGRQDARNSGTDRRS